jgi:predicted metal-dependent peptidase
MTVNDKITTWAATDTLRIYSNGKIVADIPPDQFPALILAMATILRAEQADRKERH